MAHFAINNLSNGFFKIVNADSSQEAIESLVETFVWRNESHQFAAHCGDFAAFLVSVIEPVRGRMGRVAGFRAVEA